MHSQLENKFKKSRKPNGQAFFFPSFLFPLLTFQLFNNVLDKLQSLVADTDILEVSQAAFQKTVQNQCQRRVRQHSLGSRQVQLCEKALE